LDFILGGGGFRSRIFQEIRSNRGLAYTTGSFYNARPTYGQFATYAFTKVASTTKVLSLIKSILASARKEPASQSELQYSKESIRNSFIFSFTTADQIAGQELMVYFDGLSEDYLEKYRYRIENVTMDDLKEAAGRYLADNQNVLTVVLGPEQVYQDLQKQFGNIERIEPKL
jgi:predicted Zn-dependent peptidase